MEGAGVHLKRVFGNNEVPHFDPFLLLGDFRSSKPEHYRAGFPWQMTAGSDIIHQEMPQGDNKGWMEGFQLWANLPGSHKMMEPRYRDIKSSKSMEVIPKLIGSWKLVAFHIQDSGGLMVYPFGKDAQGRLIYEPDGRMSVQLMNPNRLLLRCKDYRHRGEKRVGVNNGGIHGNRLDPSVVHGGLRHERHIRKKPAAGGLHQDGLGHSQRQPSSGNACPVEIAAIHIIFSISNLLHFVLSTSRIILRLFVPFGEEGININSYRSIAGPDVRCLFVFGPEDAFRADRCFELFKPLMLKRKAAASPLNHWGKGEESWRFL